MPPPAMLMKDPPLHLAITPYVQVTHTYDSPFYPPPPPVLALMILLGFDELLGFPPTRCIVFFFHMLTIGTSCLLDLQ